MDECRTCHQEFQYLAFAGLRCWSCWKLSDFLAGAGKTTSREITDDVWWLAGGCKPRFFTIPPLGKATLYDKAGRPLNSRRGCTSLEGLRNRIERRSDLPFEGLAESLAPGRPSNEKKDSRRELARVVAGLHSVNRRSLAELLGCDVSTVARLIQQGEQSLRTDPPVSSNLWLFKNWEGTRDEAGQMQYVCRSPRPKKLRPPLPPPNKNKLEERITVLSTLTLSSARGDFKTRRPSQVCDARPTLIVGAAAGDEAEE